MKKQIQIYLVVILLGFFACYNGKVEINSPVNDQNQIESKLKVTKATIEKIDTIFAINAPARITRKIRKDKQGNLIFASYEDVIRYNGKSFSKIHKSNGLESFDAFDAYEDKKGNIWIASTHLGLFRYDGQNYTNFTTKIGLAGDRIMCIHEDSKDNIWIGTGSGISFYNGKTFKTLDTNNGLSSNDLNTIFEDQTGKIWIGTRGSLCVYDPNELSKKSEIKFKEFNAILGNSFKNVWSIIEDKIGDLYLGGEHGLWRINGSSATQLYKMGATGVYEDKKGNIWFTHRDDDPHKAGLSFIDNNSLKSNNPKINHIYKGDGMFFGISEDKNGNIWVGTLQGVLKYDGEHITCYRNEIDLAVYIDPTQPFQVVDMHRAKGGTIETEWQVNDEKHDQLLSWIASNNRNWKPTHDTHAGLVIISQEYFRLILYRNHDFGIVRFIDDENITHNYKKFFDTGELEFLDE